VGAARRPAGTSQLTGGGDDDGRGSESAAAAAGRLAGST